MQVVRFVRSLLRVVRQLGVFFRSSVKKRPLEARRVRATQARAMGAAGQYVPHEDVASCVARTLIRSDSRPLSSVITRGCEGSAMNAS